MQQAIERKTLKITKFVKHDAVLEKVNGVDYYHLTYSLEAEALKDGGYLYICESHGKYGKVMGFEVRNSPNKGNCFVFPAEIGHHYEFDEGGYPTDRRTSSMTLAKHEDGWVVVER